MLHVIIIRINHHTLTSGHRDVKAIFIFYQYKTFALNCFYNSTANFTKEAYFISYFHLNLNYLFINSANIAIFAVEKEDALKK